MAQLDLQGAEGEAKRRGESSQPGFVFRRRVFEGVFVTDLGEVIIAGIRIAAAAILLPLGQRDVVVPCHAPYFSVPKIGERTVSMRTKSAHVPEAEDGIYPDFLAVFQLAFQG